jgi:hypothetical protein
MLNKISAAIKDFVRKSFVQITSSVPGEDKRKIKTNKTPICRKSTEVINEKKKHNGKPCKPGEERTKNFCIKKIKEYDANKTKWVRTLSPRENVRLTLVCPR